MIQMVIGVNPEGVMQETWGHLNAQPNVKHNGTVLLCHGHFDELTILSVDFGDSAGYGPWFYEHIHTWLDTLNTDPGYCYEFSGWYRHDGNNGEFVGDITTLEFKRVQA